VCIIAGAVGYRDHIDMYIYEHIYMYIYIGAGKSVTSLMFGDKKNMKKHACRLLLRRLQVPKLLVHAALS
jgi:hypothetical protein